MKLTGVKLSMALRYCYEHRMAVKEAGAPEPGTAEIPLLLGFLLKWWFM